MINGCGIYPDITFADLPREIKEKHRIKHRIRLIFATSSSYCSRDDTRTIARFAYLGELQQCATFLMFVNPLVIRGLEGIVTV